MITEKTCAKCGICKPAADFHKQGHARDGLRSRCKACTLQDQNEYNARNRERTRGYSQRYRENNRETETARQRAYHQANKERRNAVSRQYTQDHPQANAERQRRYRARKRAERLGASAA